MLTPGAFLCYGGLPLLWGIVPAMGLIPEQIVEARLARARSRVGMRTAYALGKGGFDPSASTPGKACDCSGFVAWVLHLGRQPKPARPWWIETTRVARDAAGAQRVFAKLPGPEPGAICVYGDYILNHRHHEGHIGIVATVRSKRDFDVIDCSLGSWNREDDAIAEHLGTAFRGPSVVFCTLKQDLKQDLG